MQNVLVTGGAGFIGSHLVSGLVARKVTVRVLDDLSTGDVDNLKDVNTAIEFIPGNIRDSVACRNACDGVDTVFHLAACISVPESVSDPLSSNGINVDGTLNLLLACRSTGVSRFVFSSSAAVYGNDAPCPTSESYTPCPVSPYGVQKLTGEHYARVFADLYGLETVCLRYFNVYGPNQRLNSEYAAVIPLFLEHVRLGRKPVIYGDGEQTRDFTYVSDIVAANLLAAEINRPKAFAGVFNIASGHRTTLNGLLTMIAAALGQEVCPQHGPARSGDIRHSGADIRRAENELQFTPRMALADGLRHVINQQRPFSHPA